MGKVERDSYFDNIKFILIFLVVLGHCITNTIGISNIDKAIYSFIYLFHMPCFIIVSGYFSKNMEGSFKKVIHIFIIFLEFQFIQYIFKTFILKEDIQLTFVKPYWSLWFLLALAVWKLLLPYLVRIKYIFAISIILGILVGYDDNITNYLALSRIITFLPFFLFGYYMKKDKLLKIVSSKKVKILLLISTVIIFFLIFLDPNQINYQWTYGSKPYEKFTVEWYAGIYRIILYILGFILSFFIFSIVPKTKNIFTNIGKNSLNIYLIHGFFIPILTIISIENIPTYIRLPIYIIFTILTVFLFTSNIVSLIAKPFLNPKTNVILKNNLASNKN
jgi:fucose 4-O-acetylase-like acetyltransferase